MPDQLSERGKALEGCFFKQMDHHLLERLRSEMETKKAVDALKAVCGLEDESVLEQLVGVGIGPETMISLAVVPLVYIAWADGQVRDNERKAILQSASASGIDSGSASYDILQSWMATKPDQELLDSWKAYIGTLRSSIDAAAFGQLKTRVMTRVKKIAESAGGFLGMDINTVSHSETKVMNELEAAFDSSTGE